MEKWDNLTKYSQQGWEDLNALIKLFFFWRTNKGGGRNKERSKLLPITDLLQSRLFWVCNIVPDDLWDSSYNIDDVKPKDYDDILFDEDIGELLNAVVSIV